MRFEHFLVDFDAPPRAVRYGQDAIHDLRRFRNQFLAPRDVIDVELHDAKVWDYGAEMRCHGGRQVTVVVMHGDIRAVEMREISDPLGLDETIPREIDRGHVYRPICQEGMIFAGRKQILK